MQTYKVERSERKQKSLDVFEESKTTLVSIQKEMTKLQKTTDVKKQTESFNKIIVEVTKLQTGFDAMTAVQKETEKEGERKEKMYFSLMSLSLFAATVSHAVRTSIQAIKDSSKFMVDEPVTLENQERFKIFSNRIYTEIERLLKVVDFMLKYSRTDLPSEDFNVKEVIESTFDAHETIFSEKNIEITLDFSKDLVLFGNKVFFQDIITNLISNSIKALEGEFGKKIKCEAKIDKNELVIHFYDNGIGIPKEKWDWVFEMYHTTTQQQGGAGIGLYVVKTTIESFSGTVQIIDNQNNQNGTTVCLTIPFKK